jgi:crossover junction endodeoxyribonuclease RuvC
MTPLFVGIDPGLTGAVAVLDHGGNLLALDDLPVIANGKGGSRVTRQIDPAGLAALLPPHSMNVSVALERVAARPGQGVSSVFSLGDSYGCIRGVVAALGMAVEIVTPATWKKRFQLTNDKEVSRAKATELYPAAGLHRVKDHNRAEALLLARWLFETRRTG